jgi:DNA-directed RNA polymerase specialized sigma24 family protein
MSYLLNEERLRELFKLRDRVSQKFTADNKFTLRYSKSLDDIMREVLAQLGPEFKQFPRIWKGRVFIEYSDAEALIYDGILKAIHKYQLNNGKCKFSSFLWTIIGQQFKQHEIFLKQKRHNVYLEDSLERLTEDTVKDLQEKDIYFSYKGEEDIFTKSLEITDSLRYLNTRIGSQEKQVLKQLKQQVPVKRIARSYGIPQSTMRYKINTFKRKWARILRQGVAHSPTNMI